MDNRNLHAVKSLRWREVRAARAGWCRYCPGTAWGWGGEGEAGLPRYSGARWWCCSKLGAELLRGVTPIWAEGDAAAARSPAEGSMVKPSCRSGSRAAARQCAERKQVGGFITGLSCLKSQGVAGGVHLRLSCTCPGDLLSTWLWFVSCWWILHIVKRGNADRSYLRFSFPSAFLLKCDVGNEAVRQAWDLWVLPVMNSAAWASPRARHFAISSFSSSVSKCFHYRCDGKYKISSLWTLAQKSLQSLSWQPENKTDR